MDKLNKAFEEIKEFNKNPFQEGFKDGMPTAEVLRELIERGSTEKTNDVLAEIRDILVENNRELVKIREFGKKIYNSVS